MPSGGIAQEPASPSNTESSDTDTDHPIAQTWLGIVLLWAAFVIPSVLAVVFAVAGVGSFPPVRRWIASTVGDAPRFLEVAVAVVYLLAVPVALGAVWWTAYQGQPAVGQATIIALLMLGIMGLIALLGVGVGRGLRSLT